MTPLGPGSPHFKTGRYSKFLPSRMAAAYQAALDDPRLLELRDEVAAVDARIADLYARVDLGEAGSLWREAQSAMAKFRLEQAQNNIDGMMLALTQAERCITQGAGDYAAYDEITTLREQRRKLCDSENRRLTHEHDTITADRAMALLSLVISVIQKHIADRATLGAIAADIQALVLARQENGSYA